MMPQANSPSRPSSGGLLLKLADSVSRRSLAGFLLCFIAVLLAFIAFWKFGKANSDMLVVTDYVISVSPGQTRTFGYGGPMRLPGQQSDSFVKPDVPFQSKAMSSACFSISKQNDNSFQLTGLQDRLRIGGEMIESGRAVTLSNKTTFKTVGPYGGAIFTVFFDEQPGLVRLHLASPIYFRLAADETRLTFGLVSEMVRAPIDELLIRTTLKAQPSETIKIKKKGDDTGFTLSLEDDLALSTATKSEALEALTASRGNARQGAPAGEISLADITSGTSGMVGTTRIQFTRQNPSVLLGLNAARLFGVKMIIIVALLAFLFGFKGFGLLNTQVRLPDGPIIFGCVTLFALIGLTLTARDFFLPPYAQERFIEYTRWFFYSLVLLYFVRIPLQSFGQYRWLWSYPVFLIIFILLSRPFDGILSLPPLFWLLMMTVLYFLMALAIHWLMRGLRGFAELSMDGSWTRVLAVPLIMIAVVMVMTFLTGGREALTIGTLRLHLPTLLLPLFVLATVLAISAAENSKDHWLQNRRNALLTVLFAIGVYYLLSVRDHGGTAILGVGVLAALWSASRKGHPWLFTIILAGLLVMVVIVAATIMPQERIELAWGGEEGVQRYFDQAVNLRTARDLARAGGVFGLYDQLYIPSSVSLNIYNDLAPAYVAGFFGLLGLLIAIVAYLLFYTRLFKGLLGLMVEQTQPPVRSKLAIGGGPVSSSRPMPVPSLGKRPAVVITTTDSRERMRYALAAYAVSIIIVFTIQFLWVLTATLWRRVPISGLDFQPISASVISILSFIGLLLGSIVFVYNIHQDEAVRGQSL